MTSHDMSRILSDALLADVARRTTRTDPVIWGFGVGPALVGMLRAGTALGDERLIDQVEALIRPALDAAPSPTDHLISVEALVELQAVRPGLEVRGAIERFADAIVAAARPVAGQPPVHRPDLAPLSRTIWVDCMHTDGPGLLAAGRRDDAVAVLAEASEVLQDESGLYSHSYDIAAGRANGVHWGRGQGWALHGLVLGPAAADLDRRLGSLLEGLAGTEAQGRWRTIVDDAAAPFESSVSAIVASGILLGNGAGRIDDAWLPLARRALEAAIADLDPDGGLPVSEATPAGPAAGYLTRGTGVYPWGQGPLLLALLEERNRL
jgi:rhamnogalacturonyl hydrolase YesR